jgi:hypothetical protein
MKENFDEKANVDYAHHFVVDVAACRTRRGLKTYRGEWEQMDQCSADEQNVAVRRQQLHHQCGHHL